MLIFGPFTQKELKKRDRPDDPSWHFFLSQLGYSILMLILLDLNVNTKIGSLVGADSPERFQSAHDALSAFCQ